MIKKIISGGEEGVGRAALDVAIKLDLDYGGWRNWDESAANSKGLERYNLKRVAFSEKQIAVEKNILASDGTLILFDGELSYELEQIRSTTDAHHQPCLCMNLGRTSAFDAAQEISAWAESYAIETLHVAGLRQKEGGNIYTLTLNLLETVVYMGLIEANFWKTAAPRPEKVIQPPHSVEEAVDRLTESLPLKDKALIANMTESELPGLQNSLGDYIQRHFGLWAGNAPLLESCRLLSKRKELEAESAVGTIIDALWRYLRRTHKLRLVK